ncbi:MAG: hypothetical protein MMC33_009012 [Icmadophila ericetorum]|nr:hypothetical protein [Icmadophila ericetorum]
MARYKRKMAETEVRRAHSDQRCEEMDVLWIEIYIRRKLDAAEGEIAEQRRRYLPPPSPPPSASQSSGVNSELLTFVDRDVVL